MFRTIVILIILTGIPDLSMAQSEFVDDKEGAVGISSLFTEGPHSLNLCRLNLGVSISGRIDLSISGETVLNSPENNAGFGYYLAVFPIKQQNGATPLSAAVGLGTLYYDKYRTRFIAVSVMKYFSLSKTIRVQPILTASLTVLDSTAWGKRDESEIVDQFSLPVSARFNNGLIIFISPTIVSTEERGYLGLSLGILIKLH